MVIKTWNETTDKVADALKNNLDKYNPIFMMADSGARGGMGTDPPAGGMRDWIANTSGKAIEIPIRANYQRGIEHFEYFTSSRGARKGLRRYCAAYCGLGISDPLRLVDVQEVIIRQTIAAPTKELRSVISVMAMR